jgi:hypothetical protein
MEKDDFGIAIDFLGFKPAASFGIPGKCRPGEVEWAAGAMRANRYLISSHPCWTAKEKEEISSLFKA